MGAGLIDVVEQVYSLAETSDAWLGRTLAAMQPYLYGGFGGVAAFYDQRIDDPRAMLSALTFDGMDERIIAATRHEFERATEEDRSRSLMGSPVIALSALTITPPSDHASYRDLAREVGFGDMLAIRAGNPDGTGAFFAAPQPKIIRRNAAMIARWSRLAAHLAAGVRLQRAAHRLASADEAEAVLTPAGQLLSATGAAARSREGLRRAAARIDRARTRRGRSDVDAALDGWTALACGRWSLVDFFESDGKRLVLALPNAPSASDPRALAADERLVIQYAAMGYANKLIAYTLGVPEGTIATRLRSIFRKLGVRSRVAMLDRMFALQRATFSAVDVAGERFVVGSTAANVFPPRLRTLTAAEREVVLMAMRGLANLEIATRRRRSPRTIANLLARAYRKLGIASRAELTHVFASRPA